MKKILNMITEMLEIKLFKMKINLTKTALPLAESWKDGYIAGIEDSKKLLPGEVISKHTYNYKNLKLNVKIYNELYINQK